MGELYEADARDVEVLTLDEHLRLRPGSHDSRVRERHEDQSSSFVLASGRRLPASGNHPFLTLDGWVHLADLARGQLRRIVTQLGGTNDRSHE